MPDLANAGAGFIFLGMRGKTRVVKKITLSLPGAILFLCLLLFPFAHAGVNE